LQAFRGGVPAYSGALQKGLSNKNETNENEKGIVRIYINRIARGDCNHCNSRRHVAACIVQGKRGCAEDGLFK